MLGEKRESDKTRVVRKQNIKKIRREIHETAQISTTIWFIEKWVNKGGSGILYTNTYLNQGKWTMS